MKFSKVAEKATKRYNKAVKFPKGFVKEDETNLTLYLVYTFHMELEGLKEKDLDDKARATYKGLTAYKQYVDQSVYKEVLNWAILKKTKVGLVVKLGDSKPAKGKKIYYKQQTRIRAAFDKAVDYVQGVMLNVSIAVNDAVV